MTKLIGPESEEDRIMTITKIILKLMKQNWHVLLTMAATNENRPLVREDAQHRKKRNCLTITKIWSWSPEGAWHQDSTGRLTDGRNVTLTLN
jgi:hypothetical protein